MSLDAMKLALAALESNPDAMVDCGDGHWDFKRDLAITALRAAIEQAQPDAYGYASRLAVAIWEQHYRDAAPQWKPLDDLMGVLTQIDNMTSGLTRLAQPNDFRPDWDAMAVMVEEQQRMAKRIAELEAQSEQEPVAVIGNWGRVEWLDGVHPQLGDKMYSAPPRREWVGLTDEDVDEVERWIAFKEDGSGRIPNQKLVRYIEAKLKAKNS